MAPELLADDDMTADDNQHQHEAGGAAGVRRGGWVGGGWEGGPGAECFLGAVTYPGL
jgi:hypothetical protein